MLRKSNGKGVEGEMALHCSEKLVGLLYIVSLNSVLGNVGSLYFSDFARSDHWVAALSQCFYLAGQNLEKKNGLSGVAKPSPKQLLKNCFSHL